ncbi:hypothetical protein GCM10023188_43340 [Pontibacter saemangeumensis]|uniref:Uncharacterized protein n=1 Tax=Pontibacter saemangeumensis TaxID=1084525 RepID=A0ABP8M4S3_9BACT
MLFKSVFITFAIEGVFSRKADRFASLYALTSCKGVRQVDSLSHVLLNQLDGLTAQSLIRIWELGAVVPGV